MKWVPVVVGFAMITLIVLHVSVPDACGAEGTDVQTAARGADVARPATTTTSPSSSFTFVDVFIDPHGRPLAAYQVELRSTSGNATLVGIEGGEHNAFARAPYYDPKALLDDRVVIAAFNTGAPATLPSGKTRVVRLMIRTGDAKAGQPTFDVTLHVAASPDAKPIGATVSTSRGANP